MADIKKPGGTAKENLDNYQEMQQDPWIDYLGSPLGQYSQYMERQNNRPTAERRPDIEQNINTQFWKNFKAEQGPSVGYWNDPKRIARYYNAIKYAPPGVELPPYLDREGIESAYKYLEQTREGNWLNWDPISEDDPLNIILRDMPVPPPEAMPKWEQDRLAKTNEAQVNQGYQPNPDAGQDMVTGIPRTQFDNLRGWQKALRRMMPVIQYGLPAVGGAVIGAGLGGPVGAAVGATGMSGLTAYAASLQARIDSGEEITPAQRTLLTAFQWLDKGAQLAEQGYGIAAQTLYSLADPEGYGEIKEIFGSWEQFEAAANAGKLAYESSFSTRSDGDNSFIYQWSLENPDPNVIQLPDNLDAGGWVMKEARERILAGEAPQDVINSLSLQFGDLANLRDLVGNVIFDPLDLVGPVSNKGISTVGKLTDNARLITAFSGGEDLVSNTRVFAQLNRALPVEDAANLSGFSKFISGLDAAGNVKNLTVQSKPNLFSSVFGSTPKAKASGALKNYVNGLNNLLSLETDPETIMRMVEAVAQMSPENAVIDASRSSITLTVGGESTSIPLPSYFKSTEAQSIPLAIRDAVTPLRELTDQYKMTRPHAAIIERVAEYMGVTPEKLIADFHNAKKPEANHLFSQFMIRLGDAAKAGDANAAKLVDLFAKENDLLALNGEKLKTMADAFFGKNAAPYNDAMYKLKAMQLLADSVDNWAAKWFNVKPSHALVRINDVIKRAQGILLLGFNPSYAINNGLTNITTMMWDGLLKYNGIFGRQKFLQDFGWTPAAYSQGIGAAEIGDIAAGSLKGIGAEETDLGRRIFEASKADDKIAAISELLTSKGAKKAQIMANLSQFIESKSSEVAMVSAMREYWDRSWIAGKGFDRVPDELRSVLDAVEPGLAAQVEKAIARGMNKKQIEAEIFGNLNRKSVRDVLKPDELQMLDKFPGLLDGIESGLKNAKTPDDVRKVFTDMKEKSQTRVREETIRNIETIVNDAMVKAGTEKTQGALDIVDQLVSSRNDYHLKHFEFMAQIADEASKAKGWQRQLLWMDATRKADLDWRTRNDIDAAKFLGVFRGLGAEQASPQYMQVMDSFKQFNDNLADFYTVRTEKMNEFFSLPDDMTNAERAAEWRRISEEINQAYQDMTINEDAIQRRLDKLFVDQYAKQFENTKKAKLEAQNWRSSILRVRRQMQQAMMLWRTGQIPEPMKLWGELPKEIHDAITGLNQGRGIYTYSRAARDKLNPKFYEIYTQFIRDMTTASNENAPAMVSPAKLVETELPNIPDKPIDTKPPVAQKHEADIWQILAEKKPEMAGVDEAGTPNTDAKLDVIKYVLKWSPDARGGKVRTFTDVTPAILEDAIALEKLFNERQPELTTAPKVEGETPTATPEPELRPGIEKPLENYKDVTPDIPGDDPNAPTQGNPYIGKNLADLDDYTRKNAEISLKQFITDANSSQTFINEDNQRIWTTDGLWYEDFYRRTEREGDKTWNAAIAKRTRSAIDHLQKGTRSKSEIINDFMDRILYDAVEFAAENDPIALYRQGDIDGAVRLLDQIDFANEADYIAAIGEDAYQVLLDRWIAHAEAENMITIGKEFSVPDGEIDPAPRMTPDQQAAYDARRNVIETALAIQQNMYDEIRNLPPVQRGREIVESMIFDTLKGDFARAEGVTAVFNAFAEYWAKQNPGKTADDWYETFIVGRGGDSISGEGLFQPAPPVNSPDFKTWFADSVTQENGTPKPYYHGTGSDFTEFGKMRQNDIAGYYFTDNVKDADMYARAAGTQGANVMPVYLRLTNPADATVLRNLTKELGLNRYKDGARITQELQARGYDGIVLPTETIVFTPEQVKSAFNNGKFDPNSRNILNQDAPASKTDTPEFKNWFKDSKAVDENGKPLTVYHGTGEQFEAFDKGLLGTNTGAASAKQGIFFTANKNVAQDYASYARPRWLTDLKTKYERLEKIAQRTGKNEDWNKYFDAYSKYEDAELYYDKSESTVYETYLSMQNPLEYDFKGERFRDITYDELLRTAKKNGNDGVIIKNTYDGPSNMTDVMTDVYVVFEPNQVKSIDNRGTFNPDDPRMMFQDQPASNPKGFTRWMDDGTAIMHAFESADVSTLVHEAMHVFTPQMPDADAAIVSRWLKKEYNLDLADNWHKDPVGNRAASENLARGFERYLAEGRAPTRKLKKVFENFKGWMLEIYKKITGSDIDIKLNDEIITLFDEWMGAEKVAEVETPPMQPETPPTTAQPQTFWGKPKARQQGFFESGEDTPLFSGTAQTAQGEVFKPQETAPQDSLFDMREQLPGIEGKKAGDADMPEGGLFQTAPRTDTPEFRNWFGESKVVDENGEPLSLFHQTEEGNVQSIIDNGFDISMTKNRASDEGVPDGIFLKPTNQDIGIRGSAQIELYAKMDNPLVVQNRSELTGYLLDKSDTYATLLGEFKDVESTYNAQWESVWKTLRSEGNRTEKKARLDAILSEWQTKQKEIAGKMREIANEVLTNDGYDGVHLLQDDGGFGRETETYIVFDPTQVKSVNNRGTWDPNDPRMLYQEAPADAPNEAMGAPLGTADQVLDPPIHETMFEGWTNEVSPLLDDVMNRLINSKAPDVSSLAGKLDDQGMKTLRGYLGKVYSQLADTKYATNKYAEGKRNFSLLDYTDRHGFDTALQFAFPYQFWMTRSMATWAARILTNPAILSRYMRITNFGRDAEDKEGFPQRLKGKVQIPLPFLPDWMGDSVYIDPFRHIFPFEAVTRPFTQRMEENNVINRKTYSLIQEWLANEQITEEEAQTALETMSGELWKKAQTEARASQDLEFRNPLDFAFAISSPSLPLNYLYNFSPLGSKDRISQLPITRTVQAITAAAGIGGPRGLNLEAPLRKGLGIPEVDKYEDYRVDRELSNMVADGIIDADEAVKAMIDRKGQAFEDAQRRVSVQGLPKNFASAISLDFFPEGEQEQRQLQQEYNRAIDAYVEGDKEAITKFWDMYPEYEARKTSMITDPEEKLRMFLRSKIWKSWAELNPQEKNKAATGFGSVFQDAFLNKETRSYDGISTETYAMWANSLNVDMPEQVAGAPKLDIQLPEGASKQLDQFYAERDSKFPEIGDLLDEYYNLDENSRAIMAAEYPQIDEYYAWRTRYIANHPQTAPYLTSEQSNLYGLPENVQAAVYQYRAEIEDNFPNVYETQTRYFQIVNSKEKKAFLQAHPELTAYWDYKRQFAAANPQAAPYVMSDESLARSILGEDYVDTTNIDYYPDVNQLDPAVLRLLASYFYSGKQLSSGAKMELTALWTELGKPAGSLENWLNMYVRPVMKE